MMRIILRRVAAATPVKYLGLACLALMAGTATAADEAPAGAIQVTGAWSLSTPPGLEVGSAYFVITNRGRDDRLVRVSTPAARRAELHVTEMDGRVMKMRHLEAVEIKNGEAVRFKPGGLHVMLRELAQPLEEGDAFPLTLTFEKAGSLEVQVQVKGMRNNKKMRGY